MIRGLNKITKSSGLGYMMSSYTAHPDGFKAAEISAQDAAATLMLNGLVVFAPIAYAPGIEKMMMDGMVEEDRAALQTHEFWMPIDERFFERCDYGILAMTPGWFKSTGIAIEFYTLCKAGTPVWFYDLQDERIMTIVEVADEFESEFDALVERAADVKMAHLNFDGERQSVELGALFGRAEAMDEEELYEAANG